ncbi:MAG: aminoacyl-tRNA hydrolase [Bdellovibrionaceae bacterium]|nr:aminoacyl-tRNA hydrolase [Pseudobdellovibrionaceae bacterium]
MWLIVGLGNPGTKYALTRHNIGFMAVDYLLRSLEAPANRTDFKALVNKFKWEGEEVVTVQPQTYMNLSGDSVRPLMDFYKIPLEKLIVVHDEVDLPFGKMKLQKNRSHGGHNGIKDITAKMASQDYLRVRLGVGRPSDPRFNVADYVLQKFSDEEMAAMPAFLNRATDAIEALIFEGLAKAGNRFN